MKSLRIHFSWHGSDWRLMVFRGAIYRICVAEEMGDRERSRDAMCSTA